MTSTGLAVCRRPVYLVWYIVRPTPASTVVRPTIPPPSFPVHSYLDMSKVRPLVPGRRHQKFYNVK